MAATYDDLKEALRENLDSRNVLSSLKARLRAEIFNSLNDNEETKPTPTKETALLNALVQEYLEWHGYRYSSGVFRAEANLEESLKGVSRESLKRELSVSEHPNGIGIPLLYSLVFANNTTQLPDPITNPTIDQQIDSAKPDTAMQNLLGRHDTLDNSNVGDSSVESESVAPNTFVISK